MSVSGSNFHLDVLEVGYAAWDGDAAGVVEAVLLLRLAEKIAEERVVEVDDRDKEAVGAVVFLTHVHSQMAFRDPRRLQAVERGLTHMSVAASLWSSQRTAEPMCQSPAPVADFRHRLSCL